MSQPLALVVDDEPAIRRLIRKMLDRAGWVVHEADCGSRALATMDAHRFDIVLLDVSMPEMSGITVFEAIRGRPEWHGQCVVACTAHATMGYREELLATGFDAVLTKPFTLDALRRTIAAVRGAAT